MLVFIYPPGQAASNAAGTVFLAVPYEDLYGLLNPAHFPGKTSNTLLIRGAEAASLTGHSINAYTVVHYLLKSRNASLNASANS